MPQRDWCLEKMARVLIVDDHPVVRDGLKLQIELQDDMAACGEAEDVADALAQIESTRPDVVVVDLALRTGHGLDLIKRIHSQNQRLRILAWSMHPEWLYAERALSAGAMGYVHKGRRTREIVEAIRTVLVGHVYVSSEASDRMLRRLASAGERPVRSRLETLSDRELEVFQLMGQGFSTQRLAERMHVSKKTVDTYRSRIKEKLNIDSVIELLQFAIRHTLEPS